MPFTVQHLIENPQKVITASLDLSAKQALELMIQHDVSQLPVVGENNALLGIVTSDSLLHALNHFGIPLTDLRVSHALARVKQYRPDDDLFELLDDLKESYAVVVVHQDGTLKSVITSSDTTEYFRRRAEDLMYVENIETMVKAFIRLAFTSTDEGEQQSLDNAIGEVMHSDTYKHFQGALLHYLNHGAQGKVSIDQEVAREVFAKHFSQRPSPKLFDELSLSEYFQLLLHKRKWPIFSSVFQVKMEALRSLLDGVRETRNALAHFHGEISPMEREQLHFCARWLEQHQALVGEAFRSRSSEIHGPPASVSTQSLEMRPELLHHEISVAEEEVKEAESRCAPVAI